ncbi:Uncharacterised protein [Serratia fonticola]|nr:Uncharacterised protein [Serratia fonticola]
MIRLTILLLLSSAPIAHGGQTHTEWRDGTAPIAAPADTISIVPVPFMYWTAGIFEDHAGEIFCNDSYEQASLNMNMNKSSTSGQGWTMSSATSYFGRTHGPDRETTFLPTFKVGCFAEDRLIYCYPLMQRGTLFAGIISVKLKGVATLTFDVPSTVEFRSTSPGIPTTSALSVRGLGKGRIKYWYRWSSDSDAEKPTIINRRSGAAWAPDEAIIEHEQFDTPYTLRFVPKSAGRKRWTMIWTYQHL